MRRTIKFFIVLVSLSFYAFSQTIYAQRKKASEPVRCANESVIYENVKVRHLRGKVNSPLSESIIVEIYKISENASKLKARDVVREKVPYKIHETNANGAFYIKKLSDGYYVLRFGTSDGGWNCTYIGVQISKSAKDKKIEVALEIGT